jgi:tRNA pseudouridine55 synthase
MDFDFENGEILLVDKPLEWSSFHVVKKIKYLFKIKKIGHAGTLDPLATGLMILGTGKKTKELHHLQGLDKEYEGVISLGKTTPSYDLETEFNAEFPVEHITESMILEAAKAFESQQEQFPPIFSAIKVDGKRAYKSARKGEELELKSRSITIHGFEILDIRNQDVHFRINCSKGTYIRSIAYDFGKFLNSGAHLSALRRTKVGQFDIQNAHSLEQLIQLKESLASH